MEAPLEFFVGNDCEFVTDELTDSETGATIIDAAPTGEVLTYPDGDALATPMSMTCGVLSGYTNKYYGRLTAAQTLLLERETKYIAAVRVNGGTGLIYQSRATFKVVNRQ